MNNNTEYKKLEFIAFSDGSCDNLHPNRPGGAAYIIMDTEGNIIRKRSKGYVNTTNNRMELWAIICAVNAVPDNSFVTVNTDSQYCLNALLGKNPQANLDLIAKYYQVRQQKNVTVYLHWVKGHDGNKYNEECDLMAKAEYTKKLEEIKEIYGSCITTKGRRKSPRRKRN